MEELIIALVNLTPLEWVVLIVLDFVITFLVQVPAQVAFNIWRKSRKEARS